MLRGKSYVVSIIYVNSASAKLTINGEQLSPLQKQGTAILTDGSYIGINDLRYRTTGDSQVEYILSEVPIYF